MGLSADLFTAGQHIDAKGQQTMFFLRVLAQVTLAGRKNRG
jgi:hypothetical protein